MSEIGEKLSAYLDGELSDADAAKIEQLLEIDADARAEFDALMEANAAACEAFDEMLNEPAPLDLYRALSAVSEDEAKAPAAPQTSNVFRLPNWAAMAAAVALLAMGGVGGYFGGQATGPETVQVASAGWLQDIAEYHAVYSTQKRHLVEVSADEADHIQAWLSNMVGSPFNIPDLTGQGLTFEGGRLLVAAGKPVAQLLYTTAEGKVVAICAIGNDNPASDGFNRTMINQAQMVSWRNGSAAFVVVGDEDAPNLEELAEVAATQV